MATATTPKTPVAAPAADTITTAAAPKKAVVKKAVARKPAAKSAVKPVFKKAAPATTKPVKAAKPAAPAKKAAAPKAAKPVVAKPEKPKKPKLVRDSFTIPKAEYTALEELKQRVTTLGHAAKKSEVLRAGIKALAGLADAALLSALKAVPAIKTGRPKKD